MSNRIYPGIILRNHYYIVRELGHGGFGRTYLAKDQHRFDQLCVLKEFAPQVQGSYGLQKSQELFEREAEILYKLKHPQIPRFWELFRETIQDQGCLFFVQDYIEGSTYRDLLHQHLKGGTRFREAEVRELLLKLLPVLGYLHSNGVIHRDISPDNIILRQLDGLPVLIDFGGVKQIQAKVQSEFAPQSAHNTPATRLGKVGYAPDEQMRMGIVYPHSDLYALAATALVLLTLKEPQQLIDHYHLTWNWQKEVSLSPQFGAILDKMLAQKPSDRFQSTQQVIDALKETLVTLSPTQAPPEFQETQQVLVQTQSQSQTLSPAVPQKSSLSVPWKMIALVGVSMTIMGTAGWLAGLYWLQDRQNQIENRQFGRLNEEERQEVLRDRRRLLGVDFDFFVNLVNAEFYRQYPEQQGRILTNNPEDSLFRQQWDEIANQTLDRLSKIGDESRNDLGKYTIADLDRWKGEVNRLNLSSRALYDLADAKFFNLFPEQPHNKNLLGLPIGQVWQGITYEKLQQLKTGNNFEKVQFSSNTTSKRLTGTLKPGEGKAYIARFKKNQTLQVNLEAPPQSTLISLYTPGNPKKSVFLLEDSQQISWSGRLEDSGYYEIVVVSTASETIDYELNIEID